MFITPAVAGAHVYIGSCSGKFYAFAAASGAVVWSHDTAQDGESAQFHGDALITDELVIVGSDTRPLGFLYAFERPTGEVRWRIPFKGGVATDVWRHGELALAVAVSGEVVAVEIATGDTRWLVEGEPAKGARPGDPALRDGRLYVPWRSGAVEAFDAATGERLWRRDLGAVLNTSIEAIGDSLVVGDLDGRLHRLRAEDGTPLSYLQTTGVPYGELVVGEGCLFTLLALGGVGEEMRFAGPHEIVCFEPDLSTLRWRRQVAEPWGTFHPLVWRGRVIVGFEGTLLALSSTDGSLIWQRSIPGLPRGLGASATDLFVGTLPGPVLALPWSD